MLTATDKMLIEKYLDHKLNPNSPALTPQEENFFKKRIQDSDFQNHLKLSEETNNAIEDEGEIEFIEKLIKAKHLNKASAWLSLNFLKKDLWYLP